MSLSDRRAVVTALMLGGSFAVAGCFQPMLAADSAASSLQGRIGLPEIDGRFGYFLRKSLEERLGEPSTSDWSLTINYRIRRSGLAIAQDNSVTRITLTAIADWRLRQRSNGAIILKDQVISRSGFNATTSLFATRQAEQDVERRLARDIGERISRHIQSHSKELTG